MTATLPTDGFGVYEEVSLSLGTGTTQPRLLQIANAGFKLVMNYNLLFGHASDIVTYINYANSHGLKVIVYLADPAIWRDNTYSTKYATLYADAGNPGTGTAFMQYIVGQVKNLAGTWGYYVGDEVANSDHTTWATYSAAIMTADNTHPRLVIAGGTATNSVASGTNTFYDQCEVLGDDWYPITNTNPVSLPALATEAIGVQNFTNGKNLQSAIALQAHSLAPYGQVGAPWPSESQMLNMRNTALANMQPRLVLWYSYFDVIQTGSPDFAPALQWEFLSDAILGKSKMALFPTATRRGSPSTTSYVTTIQSDSPTAYYRLTEAVGSSNAVDSTSNHYNGSISNNVTAGQAGPIVTPADTAMLFTSGGSITLPTATNGHGWSALSVEMWIKLSSTTIASFANAIAAGTTGTNSGYQVFINSTHLLEFNVGNGSSNATATYAPGFVTNVWYYVVATWDATTLRIYVNGSSPLGTASLTGTVGNGGFSPRLGSDVGGGSGFPGTIGEVAIYNAVLTPAQVVNHYRTGLGKLLSTQALFPTATRRATN